jgi:phosphopantothenoylcysteine decarboxylase/phosphopantothenate--cysteine ligase
MPEISVIMNALVNMFEKKKLYAKFDVNARTIAEPATQTRTYTEAEIKQTAQRSSNPLHEAIEKDKFNAELELELLKHGRKPLGFLSGKRVLITAGPTVERIDDVRFISNHSSGKMGYALAQSAMDQGAEVVLVSGPVALTAPSGVKTVSVESAEQMYSAVMNRIEQADIAIFSAAVADYTPREIYSGKMKKNVSGQTMSLDLVSTKDILGCAGKSKRADQLFVGFALESANELENARKKLIEKNCDMIVLNSANKPQSGFSGDDNTITLVTRNDAPKDFPPMSKTLCAEAILAQIGKMMK